MKMHIIANHHVAIDKSISICIWRMSMEIINFGNTTNNYMFPAKNGYVLIDTGYENEFEPFCKEIEKNNIELKDIAYIFLTHAHDDHAGFLNELLHHTNAKVILHQKAVEGLHRGKNSIVGGYPGRLAFLSFKAMALSGKGEHRFPIIEPQFENRLTVINDSNIAGLENELSGKILETPGHTICSISLYLNNGILFCGDAAMNGFPSIRRVTIWIENLDDFCVSWEKIITLNPKEIYPGHGKPFLVSDLERFLPAVKKLKLLAGS
jgi:glyoxylase-like metal-dependent hydrolase (beta-lactamase superfamily II)